MAGTEGGLFTSALPPEVRSPLPITTRTRPVEQVSGCDVVVEAVSDWSRSRLLSQVVGHGGIEMAE